MTDHFTGRYRVSQTWAQHIANAGARLGGVDYVMGVGTNLPAPSSGVMEWVTAATPVAQRPKWYNLGLGNAAAVRRSNGTRTIYAHCSTRVAAVGSTVSDGQVIAKSGNTGKTTGPHLHTHDVLADGITRARPFTTIPSTPAGGGVTPLPDTRKANPGMYLSRDVQTGTIWLYTDNGRVAIQSPAHVQWIQRFFTSYPNFDNFYGSELDVVYGYIVAASTADDVETAKILSALSKVAVDPKPITDAVIAAIKAQGVTVDEGKIATAVADELKARLTS